VASPRPATDALPPLLSELEAVLAGEAKALRRLDRAAIEVAMEEKLRLWGELEQAKLELTPAHRERLEALRTLARHNHVLLAHARDSIRQVLAVASGQASGAPLGGLRVDVRG
jgi:hypothetical protein